MFDILCMINENHLFGNIGRQIGYALKVFTDQYIVQGPGYIFRIGKHIGDQFPEELIVKQIHFIILFAYIFGQCDIRVYKTVDTLLYHFLGYFGHSRNIDERLQRIPVIQ